MVGIYAAGGEEQEIGFAAPGDLQAVKTTGQVGLYQVLRRASITRLRGGFGGAFQNQIGRAGERCEVFETANIAVNKGDAGLLQTRQIQFRAAPVQIVERGYFAAEPALCESDGERRSDKTAAPSNESMLIHGAMKPSYLSPWPFPDAAGDNRRGPGTSPARHTAR